MLYVKFGNIKYINWSDNVSNNLKQNFIQYTYDYTYLLRKKNLYKSYEHLLSNVILSFQIQTFKIINKYTLNFKQLERIYYKI